MAFFSKFKIGNTTYDVKDALAGKSLALSGSDLQLKSADGTVKSSVTLPGGGSVLQATFSEGADASITMNTTPQAGDIIWVRSNVSTSYSGSGYYLGENASSGLKFRLFFSKMHIGNIQSVTNSQIASYPIGNDLIIYVTHYENGAYNALVLNSIDQGIRLPYLLLHNSNALTVNSVITHIRSCNIFHEVYENDASHKPINIYNGSSQITETSYYTYTTIDGKWVYIAAFSNSKVTNISYNTASFMGPVNYGRLFTRFASDDLSLVCHNYLDSNNILTPKLYKKDLTEFSYTDDVRVVLFIGDYYLKEW